MAEDPFDVLGVSELSSEETIDAAWRRRIKLCHPDYATSDADRERRLAESIVVNRAHDILTDPVLKADAITARHRRTTTAPGTDAQPAAPAGQAPAGRGRVRDIWMGTRWARAGGYRAGGHPEDRDSWSYAAYAPPAEAQEVAPDAPPAQSGSTLDAAVRIVATTCRIFLWVIVAALRAVWWVADSALHPWWRRGRGL